MERRIIFGFGEFFPNEKIAWNREDCRIAGELMKSNEIPYYNAHMRADRTAKLFDVSESSCRECLEGLKSAYDPRAFKQT